MDNEMIERVVKASFEAWQSHDPEKQHFTLNDMSFSEREFAKQHAIAIIKAMREPTEKMLDAGREAMSSCWSLEPGEGLDEAPAPVIWEGMIDAIISQ